MQLSISRYLFLLDIISISKESISRHGSDINFTSMNFKTNEIIIYLYFIVYLKIYQIEISKNSL